MFDLHEMQAIRAARRLAYLVLGLVLAVILAAWTYATPAGAIPGSTQNPDGSWTGPNGEDLGGGNPAPEPDRPQSHEGNPTGRLVCGCDRTGQEWFVILRDGVVTAADRLACSAAPVKKECKNVR